MRIWLGSGDLRILDDVLTWGTDRLFGFFLGSSVAGGAVYYYAIQDYKASNQLLTEDIYVRLCI